MAKKFTSEKYKEIHKEAKEQFQEIWDFESAERKLMEDDKAFSVGENNAQWDERDVRSRQLSKRSFLTIMRSNQFTDYVKNQQRQNKPAVKISPEDEGATEEIATLHQDIIRQIQYESRASQARQAGFDDAVDEGRGHWIVKTEYVRGTFNKKIIIEPIPDSRCVYMDIRRKRPDYSDCKHGFLVTPLSRKEFEKRYPDASLEGWDNSDNKHWFSKTDVMIAEYYCEKYKTRELLEVEDDGVTRILYKDELKDVDVDTLNIVDRREVEEPYWTWYKMTGNEILDEEKLPWKSIPIITVVGKETIVNGKWSCKGLIRDIKQPLRLYNFISSNEADIIAKAPRAPWVGVEGQFEGHEDEFANSNISDVATLEYKPVSIGGQLAPPPQRAQYSVDLSNIAQQKQWIIEDIKAITGIYDASIGNRSNETSGVAIKAREAQGNNANFHYVDNFSMAIAHEGMLINDAIGIIYDTPRTVTMRDNSDEEYLKEINTNKNNTVGKGNFNLSVSVGPSFNTKRQEQAAGMMEMFGAVPIVQNVGADLVIRAQDWNGKDALADRLEYAIEQQIPGITTQSKPKGRDEELEFLKQQLNQAKQQMQQLGQQAQQMQMALEKADADKQATEAGKIQIELQRVEIERARLQLDAKKIQGELTLREKEIDTNAMIADLDSETKLKMNENAIEADFIKTVASNKKEQKEKEDDK